MHHTHSHTHAQTNGRMHTEGEHGHTHHTYANGHTDTCGHSVAAVLVKGITEDAVHANLRAVRATRNDGALGKSPLAFSAALVGTSLAIDNNS